MDSIDRSDVQYLLIGVDQSMYAQKVRAYLRHNSIPFQDVRANPEIFKTVVLPNAPYPLVPNLMVVSKNTGKYEVVQDSKTIVDYLRDTHKLPKELGPKRAFADMFLEMVIDDWFPLPVLYWRWDQDVRAKQETYLQYTFGDESKPFDVCCQIGQKVLSLVGGRMGSQGFNPETNVVLNENLRSILDTINQQLTQTQFLLGNQPTRADFCLFGMLHSGLMRDPVPYEWIVRDYPMIHGYILRIGGTSIQYGSKNTVQIEVDGNRLVSCTTTLGKGGNELEKSDKIPEFATKVSGLLLRDYVGVLSQSLDATVAYLNKEASGKDGDIVIPRGLKVQIDLELRGKDGTLARAKRGVNTHCAWMLQRILDSTYTVEQRSEVDKWLSEVGYLSEWKRIVEIWEGSGWTAVMTKKGIVGRKRAANAKL